MKKIVVIDSGNLLNQNFIESLRLKKDYSIEINPSIPHNGAFVIYATEKTVSNYNDYLNYDFIIKVDPQTKSISNYAIVPKNSLKIRTINMIIEKLNIEIIRGSRANFNENDLNIAEIIKEKKLIEQENKNFHKELTFASELQKSLLPKRYPKEDKIRFASKYLPTAYIGGDFFDVEQIDDDRVAVFIIDVSGHGIKSAMIASLVKTFFEKEIINAPSPKDFFEKLNEEFIRSFRDEDFLTCFLIVLDFKEMKAVYSSAAHPNTILIKRSGVIEELKTEGFIVGMFENTKYYNIEIDIHSGDKFILYTDGIIEVFGENNEQYGKERFASNIESLKNNDIEDLADGILAELLFFSKEPTFEDDLTLLLFEIL
ncbi:MAG TPA: PP2C family protein-serine/threonine phosphatase [Spirochaetota bacterium]|nr:PP2C family protein-serine/threonine phosphatase [Spirochaetota bacterium]HOS31754.1 PP2C family protein-serine/threonine phosphatase [Spirochaetota bacterium]HOS54540.1 PP2C family protein-serine/threonine phosphatase [Spirochaetota bacterium]HPK60818.1 PP2C family protein-serine/threonine phosphatase [Spirochaetota bacterium]HQF77182.1 PP2C family protein-serine/threonine phosphatase [Spirochaetota bacterium]